MERSKYTNLGIYSLALLMMGAIGIASSLATIGANFPEASQTMIQSLISVTALVIIPVTIITGKLMDYISKKKLAIVGVLFFLIGGVAPAFMTSFTMILIFRGIIGIGIGMTQTLASALVAEHYEGAEKDRVQGNLNSAQMLGNIIMSFVGGWLGAQAWNMVFYVHLLGIVSLLGVILFVPEIKPSRVEVSEDSGSSKLTSGAWFWAIVCLIFFIIGHVYANCISFIIAEKALGTASQAGTSLTLFAVGGIVMGVIFGKIMGKFKKVTISIGFFTLGIAYLIIAYAQNMMIMYLGNFICGLAFSIVMPCIMVEAGNSVKPAAAGMAIALATSFQNLGQFVSPYIINPIGLMLGDGTNTNQMNFIFGAVFIIVAGVLALIWGKKQNKLLSLE